MRSLTTHLLVEAYPAPRVHHVPAQLHTQPPVLPHEVIESWRVDVLEPDGDVRDLVDHDAEQRLVAFELRAAHVRPHAHVELDVGGRSIGVRSTVSGAKPAGGA